MSHFTVAYVQWHRCNVFTKIDLHLRVYSNKFMSYLVYLHLHKIHKRGFLLFLITSLFLPSFNMQQMYFWGAFFIFWRVDKWAFRQGKRTRFSARLPVFFAPVYFVLYYNIRCLSLSQAFQPCAKLVTLLQSVNLLCPETRVKGPVPIDSLRFQALMFWIEPWIAVVTRMHFLSLTRRLHVRNGDYAFQSETF